MFAGAERTIKRRQDEFDRAWNVCMDFRERSGARYQFQHATATRNELDWLFKRKTPEQLRVLDAECRSRHTTDYLKLAGPAAAKLKELRGVEEPGAVKAARVQLAREKNLHQKTTWFKKNLFLSRNTVAEYSRTITNPFADFSFPKEFAAQAYRAMIQHFFFVPRPCMLAEAVGILRRNRAQARRPLRLQLPHSKETSDLPEKFGRAAEAGILRAAAAAAQSYLTDRVNEKGEKVAVDPGAVGLAAEAAEAAAAKEISARFEELLSTAVGQAVQLAKSGNARTAAVFEKLQPLRERNIHIIIELRRPIGSGKKKKSQTEVETWALAWDIARPDRATLVRVHGVEPASDAFVRLGGWLEDPEILDIGGEKIESLPLPSRSACGFDNFNSSSSGGLKGRGCSGTTKGGASLGEPTAASILPAAAHPAGASSSIGTRGKAKARVKLPEKANAQSGSAGARQVVKAGALMQGSSSSSSGGTQNHAGAKSCVASSSQHIFKLRLADADWRDIQTFTNLLYSDPAQFKFFVASSMVAFPAARSQTEIDAAMEFPLTMPRDDDSREFFAMIEEQERDLRQFYPTLESYSQLDLPSVFQLRDDSIDCVAITNNPYMLYEKQVEVKPLTGIANILKPRLGPHDEGVREATTSKSAKASKDLFVFNAAVRRSYKVTKTFHYLNEEIHGVRALDLHADVERETENENQRQAAEAALVAEELEEDDHASASTGLAAEGPAVSLEEVKDLARRSMGPSLEGRDADEEQMRVSPVEQLILAQHPGHAVGVVGGAEVGGVAEQEQLIPEMDLSQLLHDSAQVQGQHLQTTSSPAAAKQQVGLGGPYISRPQPLGGTRGEDQDEHARGATGTAPNIVSENNAQGQAAGASSSSSSARPVQPLHEQLRLDEAVRDHSRMLSQGKAGVPTHPWWPVTIHGGVGRPRAMERFLQENELATEFVCKPLNWSAEGKRYGFIWDRYPEIAPELFQAQTSTRGNTRAFKPKRQLHARYLLLRFKWLYSLSGIVLNC